MDNLASQWLGYEFHAASLVGNSMKQSKCEFELDLLEPTNLCTCVYMRDREIRLSVMVANFQRDEKKNERGDPRGLNQPGIGAAVEAEGLFFRLLKM